MIEHQTVMDMLCITKDIYNNNFDYIDNFFDDNCTIMTEFTQVGIIINDKKKRICVVFRGTNCLTDWKHNLQFLQYSIKNNICIHKGYCKQMFATNLYTRIYSQLVKLLNDYPDYKLFITGHSSGGALATFFGYLLSFELTDKQITIVSFASPRIGNLAFKHDFESRTNLKHWRITNKNDLIPHVPYFYYNHVGHKIFIRTRRFRFCCNEYCKHQIVSYYKSLVDTVW